MPIRWLPFVTGIVPLVGIHICFLIAVDIGYLSACNPYIDGCASISATGSMAWPSSAVGTPWV